MDQALPLQSDTPDFLQGGGMMGARMRAFDWSRTSLGSAKDWPQGLKTAIRIMLTSRFAMWMAWGPELIFFCNDAYLPTTGVKRDWVLGERSEKVWAEIWPDIGPRIEHVLSSGEATWDDELMLFLERSGFVEESYHTFSYSPLSDDDGAVAGMLCVVAEVTERVFAARQLAVLRDLGARLAAASTRAGVMAAVEACLAAEPRDLPFALVYLKDAEGAELAAAHGLAPGHPAAPQRIACLATDAVWPCPQGTKEVADLPLGAAMRAGGGRWKTPPERALVAPIGGSEAAEPLGFLVAGLNPHRALDASYRGFVELVTSQIAAAVARADEFERERGRARALAELDRAKTAFFSNVSHEFRTPLTLMMSPLEEVLARGDGLAEEARDLVETAHRNSLRLLRLVNTLLDFSRVEAGRADAAYRPLDLSGATADLASSFKSVCERAGLSFTVACSPAPEPAVVDHAMWEKIVLNLLSNAFKFTLEGGIAVELAYGEGEARLAVRDTGVGVPAHEIPKLFERFHRVEGQQGRSFEGSGIGLALVQELVRLHGGRISVESEVGRGTTFVVAIPMGAAHLPAERVHPAASGPCADCGGARAFVEEALRWIPGAEDEAEPAADGDARRLRVLVADDNADMRGYVRRLLSGRYEVETAPDGEAALAAAKARRPDLILTDEMMPRLDGFGLLRAIRADEMLADVPVVMLSARAGEEARIEGLEAGADDYLAKPFAARELIARTNANVQLAAARRAAAEAAQHELERRRQAEEALQALNAALEQRVAQEVAERARTEQALRQAQKMEAVGQLTGGVAHDFNNLLTVIMGGLDSIRRCQTWEEARIRRSVDLALQGAQRAASLTARLLAFSRRQPLDPRPLDVNELVRDMTDLLHRTIGEQIELEGVLAPRLWTAEVDQNQLESAILNLAVNARDAMPEGGRLTIETANTILDERYAAADTDHELIPGDYVMVAVSDTGLGMSKETLGRVFEPFFTTKETGRGTGLGLSMVYGFVKQSGGHVTLDSEEGLGTTVRLYFPRYLGAESSEREQAARRAPPTSKGETILVVEDNEDVLYFSASILRELGYRVLEASEADAALRILESGEPVDLLFTDVILPGRSGKALADAALGLRPGLKVLFTTGYSRDAIMHQGRLDPGVRLISKPFTFDGLAARVRHVLES